MYIHIDKGLPTYYVTRVVGRQPLAAKDKQSNQSTLKTLYQPWLVYREHGPLLQIRVIPDVKLMSLYYFHDFMILDTSGEVAEEKRILRCKLVSTSSLERVAFIFPM